MRGIGASRTYPDLVFLFGGDFDWRVKGVGGFCSMIEIVSVEGIYQRNLRFCSHSLRDQNSGYRSQIKTTGIGRLGV